ncbi:MULTISPECIES: PDZ domain-containing protein [Pandoraea]|nr:MULTISPECIES: PDZ domain-containing protein [Pandoraea]
MLIGESMTGGVDLNSHSGVACGWEQGQLGGEHFWVEDLITGRTRLMFGVRPAADAPAAASIVATNGGHCLAYRAHSVYSFSTENEPVVIRIGRDDAQVPDEVRGLFFSDSRDETLVLYSASFAIVSGNGSAGGRSIRISKDMVSGLTLRSFGHYAQLTEDGAYVYANAYLTNSEDEELVALVRLDAKTGRFLNIVTSALYPKAASLAGGPFEFNDEPFLFLKNGSELIGSFGGNHYLFSRTCQEAYRGCQGSARMLSIRDQQPVMFGNRTGRRESRVIVRPSDSHILAVLEHDGLLPFAPDTVAAPLGDLIAIAHGNRTSGTYIAPKLRSPSSIGESAIISGRYAVCEDLDGKPDKRRCGTPAFGTKVTVVGILAAESVGDGPDGMSVEIPMKVAATKQCNGPCEVWTIKSNLQLQSSDDSVVGIGVLLKESQDHHGAEVSGVIPGSPADKASLMAGDRITEVDGTPVMLLSLPEVVFLVRGRPNSWVTLAVKRAARHITVNVERVPLEGAP